MTIFDIDYEIHMTELKLIVNLDNCADNHADGCQCTLSLVKQSNRLRAQYREMTGHTWSEKTDLSFSGLNHRLKMWYIRHRPDSAALTVDDLMPASEVR